MGPHEFLHEVINAMMLSENTSTRHSRYAEIGGGVTLRLADHYGEASNFKIHNSLKNNYGLVIKLSNHRYKSDKEVDYLEYVYFPDKLSEERQLEILKGLKGFIKTGRFDLLPTPDTVHPSGKFDTPDTRLRSISPDESSEGRVEGSSPSMNNPQQTEGAVGGIEAPTTSPSVQTGTSSDNRTADTALDSIEQATADYAESLNTERGAIIDAITPSPDDSPATVARMIMFRAIGGKLLTMGNNMWAY